MSQGKKRRSQQRSSERHKEVEAAVPLGKYLASTEKKIRDGAIKSLAKYLAQSDREPLSEADMSKLWKGIFYCFWMSDKPLVQQALAQELADLLLTIKAPSSSTSSPTRPGLLFLEGFFDAIVREWPGLDKWRVDKFYLLFRRFLNAAFRLLARQGWEEEGLTHFTASLTKTGGPLCANDIKVPDGITYHLADIYIDELEKAVQTTQDGEEEDQAESVPALRLLQPFIDTMSTCHSSLVYDRIYDAVLRPFLEDCLLKTIEAGSDAEDVGQKRKTTTAEIASKRQRREEDLDGVSANEEEEEEEGEEEGEIESACQYPGIISHLESSARTIRKEIFGAMFLSASRADSLEARRRRMYRLCRDEEERLEEEGNDI